MTPEQLKEILRLHGMWLRGEDGGTRANLADANLAGANLARANLADANLAGAYLARANLADANLADANLAGADLARANLADAKGIADVFAVSRIGSRNGQTTFARLDDGSVYVWCGCFRGTLDEFAARVQETHGDNEHGRAYRMVIEMAKLRLTATPAEGGGA